MKKFLLFITLIILPFRSYAAEITTFVGTWDNGKEKYESITLQIRSDNQAYVKGIAGTVFFEWEQEDNGLKFKPKFIKQIPPFWVTQKGGHLVASNFYLNNDGSEMFSQKSHAEPIDLLKEKQILSKKEKERKTKKQQQETTEKICASTNNTEFKNCLKEYEENTKSQLRAATIYSEHKKNIKFNIRKSSQQYILNIKTSESGERDFTTDLLSTQEKFSTNLTRTDLLSKNEQKAIFSFFKDKPMVKQYTQYIYQKHFRTNEPSYIIALFTMEIPLNNTDNIFDFLVFTLNTSHKNNPLLVKYSIKKNN